MTKITTYNRGIIIDGHADTKEECETITLLCNSLAKDENFKQVAYDDGYAAFEKIGKAERLRFAPPVGHATPITVNGDVITINTDVNDEIWQSNAEKNLDVYSISGNTVVWNDGTILQYNGVDVLPTANIIDGGEYTTGAASSKLSVDLTTLSGWSNLSSGSHTIKIVAKGTGYRDSEKSSGVSVTKPSSGYNVTVTYTYNYQGDCSGLAYYSTDDGATWIDLYDSTYPTTKTIENITQIKFKSYKDGAGNYSYLSGSGDLSEISFGNPWQGTDEVSANVVLTQNSSINVSYGD